MKYAHSVRLTAFSYESEDNKSILDALFEFFPFSLEKNKVIPKRTEATGLNDRKIEVFEITLAKNNLINQFLRNLLDNMDKNQKEQLLNQLDSRLDKNHDFFIRLDKNSWIKDKKMILTDSGRCFHLKISLAAFPKKREIALNIARELFRK